MTYHVKAYFEDLQDHGRAYQPGDVFPRLGYVPTAERIAELLSDKNRRGKALIEADEVPVVAVKPVAVVEPVIIEEKPKPKRGRKKKVIE